MPESQNPLITVALPSKHTTFGVRSDQMKTQCDKPASSMGYQEDDWVWLYRPTRTKGKSPNLQSSWEGPCKIVNWINDVVYGIQKNPRSRMMIVHLDWLAPYEGAARDERI
jgi:hypothetical protein